MKPVWAWLAEDFDDIICGHGSGPMTHLIPTDGASYQCMIFISILRVLHKIKIGLSRGLADQLCFGSQHRTQDFIQVQALRRVTTLCPVVVAIYVDQ